MTRKLEPLVQGHGIDCPGPNKRLPQMTFTCQLAYRIRTFTRNVERKSSNHGDRPTIADSTGIPSPSLAPALASPVPPFDATVTTIQCMCLNTVLGISAVPLLCTVSGNCPDGTSVPAPIAVAALVISSSAQVAGTCFLVASEAHARGTSLRYNHCRRGRSCSCGGQLGLGSSTL
ncbi:hypothetical protein Vafri_12865 [Volvox africanus]|uniref:Uncharacterized protein n=1 Tax=Volvox africanus TaxID=51714 RepID=A0A8J4BAD0_9CHLO|nr:hypothetical protein Vafri_12865 [Volvox africanus]